MNDQRRCSYLRAAFTIAQRRTSGVLSCMSCGEEFVEARDLTLEPIEPTRPLSLHNAQLVCARCVPTAPQPRSGEDPRASKTDQNREIEEAGTEASRSRVEQGPSAGVGRTPPSSDLQSVGGLRTPPISSSETSSKGPDRPLTRGNRGDLLSYGYVSATHRPARTAAASHNRRSGPSRRAGTIGLRTRWSGDLGRNLDPGGLWSGVLRVVVSPPNDFVTPQKTPLTGAVT